MIKRIKNLKDFFTRKKDKKSLRELHPYLNSNSPRIFVKELSDLLQYKTIVLGTVWRENEVLEVTLDAEDFEFEFTERDALLVIWRHFTTTLGMVKGLIVVQLNVENGFSNTLYPMWLDGYDMDKYLYKPGEMRNTDVTAQS